MRHLLRDALIVNEGRRFHGYVVIEDDMIAETGEGEPSSETIVSCDSSESLEGMFLLPGVIDTHVHFRDGGAGSEKGDIGSESRAARAGGVTTCFDMPNTVPATISLENLKIKMKRAAEKSSVNYGFFIGATNSNIEELLAADYSMIPGVKIFMGASTGNMLVDNESSVRRIFSEVNALKAVHAENQGILNSSLDALKEEYGDDEIPVYEHPRWRPAEACVKATATAVALARETGSCLHVCHLSTAAEASMFPAQKDVCLKKITSETAPHYLWFGGKEDYITHGARIKCNPAIKDKRDAEALLKALIDGRIDTVATDHAPHLLSAKQGNLLQAASGMPGVQFSLVLMLELTLRHPELTVERVVEVMSHNPALIFGIEKRGFIRAGMKADIVVVRRLENPRTITDDEVLSTCGWTPYDGERTRFEVVKVYVNGLSGKASAVTFHGRE